jgi:hypothetical protein
MAQFERAWCPPKEDTPMAGVFNCHNHFYYKLDYSILSPLQWSGGNTWDINYFSKLLLYYPRIAITLPHFGDYNWFAAVGTLRHLALIKPLIDAGIVVVIPDRFIARQVGWDYATKKSVLSEVQENDLQNSKIKKILDDFELFSDKDYDDEGRRGWEVFNNYMELKFKKPLRLLNEDLLLSAELDAELLTPNQSMFSLLTTKLEAEPTVSSGSIWAREICQLPNLTGLSVDDLFQIRRNEEVFGEWRAILERGIRTLRVELMVGNKPADEAARRILNDEFVEAAQRIKLKVKEGSLKTHANNALISFGAGAAATALTSSDPLLSIATGAITSSLKLLYDLIAKRMKRTDRILAHLYTMFAPVQSKDLAKR